jgi:hypothetical protein
MERKWALNVLIACSAQFWQCISGGTNKLGLPGKGDGMLAGCTGLVVQDLEIN